MSRELAQIGVAAFMPTTMSASVGGYVWPSRGGVMENPEPNGSRVLARIASPFLAESTCGRSLRNISPIPVWTAGNHGGLGHVEAVRMITMAPERAGAEVASFVRRLRRA